MAEQNGTASAQYDLMLCRFCLSERQLPHDPEKRDQQQQSHDSAPGLL